MNSTRHFRRPQQSLLAALALIFAPALSSSADDPPPAPYDGSGSNTQLHNPEPLKCCECLAMYVVGVADRPERKDGRLWPSSNGEYRANVTVFYSGGDGCPDAIMVKVTARLITRGVVVHITDNGTVVSKTDPVKTLPFTLPPDIARHGDTWEFSLACARPGMSQEGENEGTVTVEDGQSGCSTIELTLGAGCRACSDSAELGEASCSDTGSPGARSDSFTVTIPTTRSKGGLTEGELVFFAEGFSNPGRTALHANVPPDFTVVRGAGGVITSVDTGEATLEVTPADEALLDVDPNAFVIIHKDVEGAPFRTTTISFITEGQVQSFRMDTTFAGTTTRHEQTLNVAGNLVLEKGRVLADGTFEPLWQETLAKSQPAPGTAVHRRTRKERATADDDWRTVSDIETTWENQLRGWVLTKEVIDPSDAQLTSTWSYYQPGEPTGPGGSTVGVGRLKHHLRHDGYEAFHTYSLHQATVATPFAGDPAGQTTTTTWDPVNKSLTTTVTAGGHTLSETVTSHTAATRTVAVSTGQGPALQTVTTYVPAGEPFGGSPLRVLHPDGTLTTYAYTLTQDGGLETITSQGATTDNQTVSEGVRTITVTNGGGHTISRGTRVIGHGPADDALLESMVATATDDILGRPTATLWLPANVTTTTEYSCCGIAMETDLYRISTYHAFDGIGRRIKTNRLGVTTETRRNGLTVKTYRYPESVQNALNPAFLGTSSDLVAQRSQNLSGSLEEDWSPDPSSAEAGALVKTSSRVTAFRPAAEHSRTVTTTVPGNHVQTEEYFLDGRLHRTHGALAPAMEHAYTPTAAGLLTSRAYLDGEDHHEINGSLTDLAGRTLATGRLATLDATELLAPTLYHYSAAAGQLEAAVDPDGVTTLYAYNARGERTTTALDLNRNYDPESPATAAIDLGTDQATFSETVPVLDASENAIWLTTEKVWYSSEEQPPQVVEATVSTTERRPDGLASRTWQIGRGATTSTTVLQGSGAWKVTAVHPDDTYTETTYVGGLMDVTANYSSDEVLISSTSMRNDAAEPASGYDALNRPTHARDSRTGLTTTAYISATADAILSVTPPAGAGQQTVYTYDSRGRRTHVDAPNTPNPAGGVHQNITVTGYYADGAVQSVTGDQTYPVSYTYDYAGRMQTLTTFGTEEATTTGIYNQTTGFLDRKEYDDGNGTSYEYTDGGRLWKRTWQRGVITTYGYDDGGRLVSTTYSDDTPDVVITLDALGRRQTVTQNLQSRITFTYAADLALDTETIQYDTNHDGDVNDAADLTRTLDRSDDAFGRDTGWVLHDTADPPATEHAAAYTYDSAGRLATVAAGGDTFTYAYEDDSTHLLATVTGPVHTVANTWEATRDVLATKINAVTIGQDPPTPSAFHYTVNDIGQRTGLRLVLDENDVPISTYTPAWDWDYNARGELVEADDLAGSNDRAYQFDAIGNRKKTADGLLGDLPQGPNYAANALNQYTMAEGVTLPAAPVPAPCDSDGNLRFDGGVNLTLGTDSPAEHQYYWDGENRLIEVAAITRNPNDPAEILTTTTLVTYAYDALSRRIAATVVAGQNAVTTLFLYDGWNPLAEYAGGELKVSYTWGMDLSGTLQGAGGVGGLLAVRVHGDDNAGHYYPAFDGNGNVTEYLDDGGAVQAHYEYDPFGRDITPINDKGDLHDLFTHRFSTKPLDSVTGLCYYGYRYYDPLTGRWPSRDPIDEQGGVNLYGFVNNNAIYFVDDLGTRLIPPGENDGWSWRREPDGAVSEGFGPFFRRDGWGKRGDKELNVDSCEAYLIYTHSPKDRKKYNWHFNGDCGMGGYIGCFPKSNNPPKDHRWPNMASHDNIVGVGDSPAVVNDNRMGIHTRTDAAARGFDDLHDPRSEHDMRISLRHALAPPSIKEIFEKLCESPCCCPEVKFTIDIRPGRGIFKGLKLGGYGGLANGGKITKTFKCSESARSSGVINDGLGP